MVTSVDSGPVGLKEKDARGEWKGEGDCCRCGKQQRHSQKGADNGESREHRREGNGKEARRTLGCEETHTTSFLNERTDPDASREAEVRWLSSAWDSGRRDKQSRVEKIVRREMEEREGGRRGKPDRESLSLRDATTSTSLPVGR